jgi:hypothetical protein
VFVQIFDMGQLDFGTVVGVGGTTFDVDVGGHGEVPRWDARSAEGGRRPGGEAAEIRSNLGLSRSSHEDGGRCPAA